MNKVFNLSTPFFNSSSNAATPCNDDDIDKFAPVDFDVVDVVSVEDGWKSPPLEELLP